jgi:DNA-damage-inducible protein J
MSVQVNARLDSETKKQWEAICDSIGINISTAISMLAKAMIKEKRIPFDTKVKETFEEYYEKNLVQIETARENIKRGEYLSMTDEVYNDLFEEVLDV